MAPLDSSKFANSVLKHIGVIKDQLLAFGVIACLILNIFAIPLDATRSNQQNLGGLIMHLSTIPILLLFGAMYCYASIFLPSSKQELAFTEEAARMTAQHSRRSRKQPAGIKP